jgi:L,D-transpeptidase ErfK/SrfK
MFTVMPAVIFAVMQLVGGEWNYIVRSGDSVAAIAARYGADARVIAETNGIPARARLENGQALRLDNRHIVPPALDMEIVINLPQRMLFHLRNGAVTGYPIGAGKPSWPTPAGSFEIIRAEIDPVWDVPPSIQAEMQRQGKPVVTKVPPGPRNPLGKYWLGLSGGGIGIHGTNAPSSIYGLPSHGCIRLHPDDIHNLFQGVGVGTRGMIIYEPVLIAFVDGAVFLEAHPDAYGKEPRSLERIREAAIQEGYDGLVDWDLAQEVIRKRDGVARDVTQRKPLEPNKSTIRPAAAPGSS